VVAFLASMIGSLAGFGLIVWFGSRRPPGTPTTWGEAFLAATFVFFLMLMAYGVWPHQWLAWADNELQWRSDRILLNTYPITVTYQALRDIVAVLIYVVALGLHVAGWVLWQGRGREKPKELPTSPFGRPLVKKS
jgi:hypothetical protein